MAETLEAYRAQSLARAERATRRDGVAMLYVQGSLFKRANLMTEYSGASFQYGAAVSSVPDGFLDENTWRRCTQKMLISGAGTVIGPGDLVD